VLLDLITKKAIATKLIHGDLLQMLTNACLKM